MPNPWPTIQPVWSTSPITTDFRNRWINQFGDKRKAIREPNGQISYPTTTSGVRMLRTLPGSDPYHRSTVAMGQGGGPTDREIPYAAQLREADQTPNDPFKQYRSNPAWNQSGIEGSLARAAAIDAYKNSHDVSPENNARFQTLRNGSEIMSDLRTHLANVSDADISKLAQAGIDFSNFFGKNLDQPVLPGLYGTIQKAIGAKLPSVNPNVIAVLNDVARARAAGLLAPPTGVAQGAASPMELIPSGGLKELLGLEAMKTGGQAVWDYLGKKENLTNLRKTLPQDLNKTNQLLYDTVAQDPQGRWKQDQYDYVNRIAANPGFTYGGNAYGESPAIPAPDKSTPDLVNTPVLPLSSQTQPPPGGQPQPGQPTAPGQPPQPGQPQQPGQPVAAPIGPPRTVVSGTAAPQTTPGAAATEKPFGQRLLETLGHFFTFSLGQHGQPQQAQVSYYAPTTQQPRAAPIATTPTRTAGTATTRPAAPIDAQGNLGDEALARAAIASGGRGQRAGLPSGFQIQHGWGTPISSGVTMSQATTPVFNPGGLPPGFNREGWGTPTYPVLPPIRQVKPFFTPMETLPGQEPIWGAGTTSAAPATGQDVEVGAPIGAGRPQLSLQEHVDRLQPGAVFDWHDGNRYVKT